MNLSSVRDVLPEVLRLRTEHYRYPIGVVESHGNPGLMCGRCGFVPLRLSVWMNRGEVLDEVMAALREHEHPAPKPLTPDERELVRVLGIHRRGAMRCA